MPTWDRWLRFYRNVRRPRAFKHNNAGGRTRKRSGAPQGPARMDPTRASDLFLEHGLAARFADLIDEGLHLPRRLLAHEADHDDHQEAERHPQQAAVDVVEVEPADPVGERVRRA